MARKKKHEKEPNHERWLVSYADFITLLFAVFTTLYAMSQTDKKKVEEVMMSLRESFGYSKTNIGGKPAVMNAGVISIIPNLKPQQTTLSIPPKQPGKSKVRTQASEKDFVTIKAAIETYLLKSGAQAQVSVDITRRGLVVSLKEAGFFDSGSAAIKKSSVELLAVIAESLNQYTNFFRVEGHTDNVPINTAQFPSNWELSTARATNIVHYLIESYGYDTDKISAAGYGEFRPVADNGMSEGRAKNRRVDLVLLSKESELNEP